MIVMKFGGSSLESAEALERVAAIVSSEIDRKPIVVVSAMGNTTDQLIAVSKEAGRCHGYEVWKAIKELQEFHLNEAHRVVQDDAMAWLELSLRRQFRDLHVKLLSAADEGCPLTPALRDEVLSYGERWSSEVVAAVLQSSGVPAVHLDSRRVILTDAQYSDAKPLLWETYAKIRRVIPTLGKGRVVVMGGFIGAAEDGTTTTMGRGGSDLTATLVGAGVSADEVQVWKDVDGLLTCDPKLLPGGYRVKSVSYGEAAAMAKAGAKLLHPETVSPVIRQRIPIVIRNSRRPNVEGTAIEAVAQPCKNPVKSISCKQTLTVLEVRSNTEGEADTMAEALEKLCARNNVRVEFSGSTGKTLFLGVNSCEQLQSLAYSNQAGLSGLHAHAHSHSALITLVGEGIHSTPGLMARAVAALRDFPVVCVPDDGSGLKLSLIVPQPALKQSVALLHREFFEEVDPAVFTASEGRAGSIERATCAAPPSSGRVPGTRPFPQPSPA
jgi:aspartate kinase